ncbi:MAG TPA: phage holin family protein [Terriglobales bacterium]|jgi:uncharacterized membrane protein YqjE|nr:phage holin family protein [Terriglobales bacterium]
MHDIRGEENSRTLGAILSEIADEMKEFLNTRIQMLKSELHETLAALSVALPLVLLALLLVGVAFLVFTAAVVTIIAAAFSGSQYAWFYSFIIVGALWTGFGGVAAFFAYNEFRAKAKFPKHTVQVLKADKVWIESEARTKNGRAA